MENEKVLTIKNGELEFSYTCTKTIHTKVSEEVLLQLKTKDRINVEQIVLGVIVDELGLGSGDWELVY
jgi:hypothetical protein